MILDAGFATFAGRRLSKQIPCVLNLQAGDGIHNFDFGKPIRIAPREYPVGAVNTQEDQK